MAAPTFVLQAAINRAVEAAKAGGGGGLREPFVPSPRFAGVRNGYHFKMGDQGLGYYFDPLNERPEGGGGASGAGAGPSASVSAARPAAAALAPAELLAAAEAAAGFDSIQALDARSARRLCAAFERAARANLEARLKHAGEPHRFLQTEVDLDEMVKSLLQARLRGRARPL